MAESTKRCPHGITEEEGEAIEIKVSTTIFLFNSGQFYNIYIYNNS